jgi:hypothetical protein|tara:strand:+ start:2341 stop:2517 length:177 start_codon:yes stop_codon:yes gene_type:complete
MKNKETRKQRDERMQTKLNKIQVVVQQQRTAYSPEMQKIVDQAAREEARAHKTHGHLF